jgi:ribosome maturation factor RimP
MDKQEIIEQLSSIIGDYLKIQGLDLVDLIYRREGSDFVLRILVDKPEGGITIGECTILNKQIGNLLDEKDVLEARYVLEVASPGLDRPLKTKSDFLRCINKKARFFFNEQINSKFELEGLISKLENDMVYIDIQGETIEVPLTKINQAKQIII